MRIRSVTLRHYRIHREVQVELDPSLTLIGGPNEAGKSTLVEALHRLLFLKARITGETQSGMVSTVFGGHPEVEARIEFGSDVYTVVKRFAGASGYTRLTDASGRMFQNDEAEAKLAELLRVEVAGGGRGAGDRAAQQWAHLWVWQGNAGANPTGHVNAHQEDLLRRLRQMGGAAVLQSDLDASLARRFAEEVDSLFTSAGKPKAGSDLELADRESRTAGESLARARERLDRLHEAAIRLERAARDLSASGKDLELLRHQQLETESKLRRLAGLRETEARQAPEARQAADRHKDLLSDHQQILRFRQDMAGLEQALAPEREELTRLKRLCADRQSEATQAEIKARLAAETVRKARLTHELASARLLLREREEANQALQQNGAKIAQLKATAAAIEESVARLPQVDARDLKKLNTLAVECSNARAALQAMAAGLEVLASDQDILAGGSRIELNRKQILTEETDITIGPSIRLRIQPGGGTTLAEARRLEQSTARKLQETLDALGLRSVEEAATAHENRKDHESRLKTVRVELAAVGAERYEAELQKSQSTLAAAQGTVDRLSALAPTQPAFPSDATEEARAATAQAALRAADEEETAARATLETCSGLFRTASESLETRQRELNEKQRTIDALSAQVRLLVQKHGDEAQRSGELAAAQTAQSLSDAALAATRASIVALEPELLQRDEERIRRAIDQKGVERTEAEKTIAVCRSELQSDGSEDPEAALAMAQARWKSAERHRESLVRRGQAIRQLRDLFEREQRALALQFTQPLADKVSGYLRCLFGFAARAEVSLENNQFTGLRLERPGTGAGPSILDFETLSGGTREQTAAAVRLAMAEVLAADHGGCLPVVFDDAFAYSDPDRVNQLQRMLDLAASRGLQIVVLTCNPADYATLGARTITLTHTSGGPGDFGS